MLTVRLATGISRETHVLTFVNSLLRTLSRYAKKADKDSREAVELRLEKLLDKVVRFQAARILKRTGLKQSDFRRSEFNMSRLLSAYLAEFGWDRRIKALLGSIQAAVGEEDQLSALKEVVRRAHDVCYPGGLPETLQKKLHYAGRREGRDEKSIFMETGYSRALMDVAKLADYYEGCRVLLRLAELQPRLFSAFQVIICPRTSETEKVHAEMLLILHYEQNPMRYPPRAIGCNKSACYFCHAFIRTQGQYWISRAHNRVYRWQVPAWNYTEKDRKKAMGYYSLLERTLSNVNEDLMKSESYRYPNESVPNSQTWVAGK